MLNGVFDCTIVDLPIVHNVAGNITAINNRENTLPFEIRRVYYVYDIPGGKNRGGHAHKALEQLVVAAAGSFDVTIDDGSIKRTFHLSRPYRGLHLKQGVWRHMDNFSSGAIVLVLTSDYYDENDYIRDYEQFLRYRGTE